MDLEKARVNDERLMTCIGKLTVTWAHLEFALDFMILLIHKTMDGEKHDPKGLPRALKDKIRYLRAAFRRLGVPADDLPRYMAFLDAVSDESVNRHHIIHGFPIHHPSDEGEAKLVRILIQKSSWERRPVTITIASVTEATQRASQLTAKASKWADFMHDAYVSHVRQSPRPDAQ